MNDWKNMMANEKFNFLKFMTTESQILKSKAQGLPIDTLSTENSIIIFNS
jgi:dynein heavy chain 2